MTSCCAAKAFFASRFFGVPLSFLADENRKKLEIKNENLIKNIVGANTHEFSGLYKNENYFI